MLTKQTERPEAEKTIDDWVKFFHGMHQSANKERSPAALWLEMIDEATKLTEEARKNKPEQILTRAVTMFSWFCGFAGKYTIAPPGNNRDPIGDLLQGKPEGDSTGCSESLAKWIWMKFPERCPVCAGERCFCPTYRKLAEERHAFKPEDIDKELGKSNLSPGRQKYLQKLKKEIEDYEGRRKEWHEDVESARKQSGELQSFLKKRLDDQIDMLIDIYGGTHFDLNLLQVTSKLLEEVGEAGRAILALSELWEVQTMLEKNKLQPPDKEALARGIEALLEKSEQNLPTDYAQRVKKLITDRKLDEVLQDFRQEAAKALKGELADVFSWLTGVLYKVGTSRREHLPEEEQEWYQFFKLITKHHKKKDDGSLCCPTCEQTNCDQACLWLNICETILKDKEKEHKWTKHNGGVEPMQGQEVRDFR